MSNTPIPFKHVTNTYYQSYTSQEVNIKQDDELTKSIYQYNIPIKPPKFISTANLFNPNIWNIHQFEIGKYLGSGRFGRAYLAREKRTKYIVVLKQILKKQVIMHSMEYAIINEIEINSQLDHPNILKMFGYFHDETHIYLILEYAPYGELFYHLKKQPQSRFRETKAAKYILQVVSALLYCHSKNIIHRDLKPENLLVFQNDQIKLADFGWAAHTPSNVRQTYCGTPEYLAPELVANQKYSSKLDVWTIGILAYELVCGQSTFLHQDKKVQEKNILNCKLSFPNYVSDEFRDFISRILVKDPNKRINIKELMIHKWLQQIN